MPQYFFHVRLAGGDIIPDRVGKALADRRSAEREAAKRAAELSRDGTATACETVEVEEETGATVAFASIWSA